MNTPSKAAFFLIGVLANAGSVYATDTVSSTVDSGSQSGTNDDSFGLPSTGSGQEDKQSFTPIASGAVGRLTHLSRSKAKREDLEIRVRIPLGSTLTKKTARTSLVVATFPNGASCDLDFTGIHQKKAEFKLELRTKNGNLKVRRGECSSGRLIPSVTGGTTSIALDVDSDPNTINTALLEGSFH